MTLDPELEKALQVSPVDVELTLSIIERYNSGFLGESKQMDAIDIPEIDNKTVIDRKGMESFSLQEETFLRTFKSLLPEYPANSFGRTAGGFRHLTVTELETIGVLLYPQTVFGILNGGSATSYIDRKKNRAFDPELFSRHKELFDKIAGLAKGKAKGITPAFVQKNGTPGPSFMELKMRALLIQALRYQILTGKKETVLSPFFQMTSTYNDAQIREELTKYRESPLLKNLAAKTGIDTTQPKTGVQPLIAAFFPPEDGGPLQVFTAAWGKKNSLLPLPGGHGQNFMVLRDIYTELYESGKRFAYLGNIDNLGSTVDPVSLAILALTGKPAAFDFSYKTPVDTKGGVLVRGKSGKLNCVDIGPAISPEKVKETEKSGKPVLFNCATGLFSLQYLVEHLDMITEGLPVRFSIQDKDAGRYFQAEQVTWEVMGLMDDFIIFAVDKYQRFLAAKILMEGIITSGIDPGSSSELAEVAAKLKKGLAHVLEHEFGFRNEGGIWVPKSVEQLVREYIIKQSALDKPV